MSAVCRKLVALKPKPVAGHLGGRAAAGVGGDAAAPPGTPHGGGQPRRGARQGPPTQPAIRLGKIMLPAGLDPRTPNYLAFQTGRKPPAAIARIFRDIPLLDFPLSNKGHASSTCQLYLQPPHSPHF